MRLLRTLLPLSLLLAPRAAAAQTPFVGLGLGTSGAPDSFNSCREGPMGVADGRAGLLFGRAALDARLSVTSPAGYDCAIAFRDEVYLPGRHTFSEDAFEASDVYALGELRARYDLALPLPISVAAGGGWITPQDLPYALLSAGVRTRGRVRLAAEIDRRWFHVPYDLVVRDVDQYFVPGAALSTEHRHEWRGGVGVRVGAEFTLH